MDLWVGRWDLRFRSVGWPNYRAVAAFAWLHEGVLQHPAASRFSALDKARSSDGM